MLVVWGFVFVWVYAGCNIHLRIIFAVDAGDAVISIIGKADDNASVILDGTVSETVAALGIGLNINIVPAIIYEIRIIVFLDDAGSVCFVEILGVISATDVSISVGDIWISIIRLADDAIDVDVGFFGGRKIFVALFHAAKVIVEGIVEAVGDIVHLIVIEIDVVLVATELILGFDEVVADNTEFIARF